MNSRDLLERLVGLPTVSRDSNLALIEFVREFLEARGIPSQLFVDPAGQKANLFATVGPRDAAGIMLSGHTDVVPVDGQRWSSDPFRLTERSGRLFGRGTADMKGFLASALAAADRASRRPLRVPLHLAFSYDEEVGCLGVRSLIAAMAGWTHRPRFCIVGEPTSMRTAIGHKGKTALKATCLGHAAHSALPVKGVNAIYLASELVESVRARQRQLADSGARDPAYEVPYTTLHVGVVHGGTVLNIVPNRCELELEIRNLVADDPDAIVAGLRADGAAIVARNARPECVAAIELALLHEYPGLDTPPDSDVVALATALTGHRETVKVAYGSEGGLFSGELGIPTVVCGPGSIDQAHRPDEYLDLEQLHACDAMLEALLERIA